MVRTWNCKNGSNNYCINEHRSTIDFFAILLWKEKLVSFRCKKTSQRFRVQTGRGQRRPVTSRGYRWIVQSHDPGQVTVRVLRQDFVGMLRAEIGNPCDFITGVHGSSHWHSPGPRPGLSGSRTRSAGPARQGLT